MKLSRQKLVIMHPRVKALKRAQPCSAFVYSRYAGTKMHSKDEGVRKAAAERARCKNGALYVFRELKPKNGLDFSDGEEHAYCWSHLNHHGLFGNMREEQATNKWFERMQARGYEIA